MNSDLASSQSASLVRRSPAEGGFYRSAVLRSFSNLTRGHLRIELPGGDVFETGIHADTLARTLPLGLPGTAQVRVRREAFFKKCVLAGDIGFAESFIDGDWDSPKLTAVVAWFILNLDHTPTLSGSASPRAQAWTLNLLRIANRLGHLLRPNTRATARRNIQAHYDLSNDFFALFLDPSLMYSAARWPASSPDLSLAEAQREKNEALCRKLRLASTDHVLEIGTGWGGWSLHAAQTHGCRITTTTISRRQFDLARRRIADAGLAGRVEVLLCDYRDLTGRYDKIVSIEMMEAVGHRYLPGFCAAIDRLLKLDGLFAAQFITCPDARYAEFRSGVDFIQKHVFPGSLLLSLNRVNDLLARAGGFVVHGVEDFGHDYARTLRHWRENFRHRLDEVRALGFDDRFIRKWTYYLSYCEAAFAMRNISVVQTVHSRPNNLSL